jgi:hypothetical protein
MSRLKPVGLSALPRIELVLTKYKSRAVMFNLFVRVPPGVISLRRYTPKVVGVLLKLYTQSMIYI